MQRYFNFFITIDSIIRVKQCSKIDWRPKSRDVTGSSRERRRGRSGIPRRRRAREGRKGGQYKRRSAEEQRDAVDHPRERFRTGWESAAHAVFSFGGSLILFAYPGTVRHRRDLSLSRGLPGILLSVGNCIFVSGQS